MKRREFIAVLGGAAAAWPLAARGQQPVPMKRIGVFFSAAETDSQTVKDTAALKLGLKALGWTEGVNLQIEYRWAAGDAGRARSIATELVGLSPVVILGSGTVAMVALHGATNTVPIVFLNVTDPVAGGFVASLSRPSGNITGFTPFEYDIGGKWLELLREMAPHLARVALLGDPNNHNFKGFQASFEAAAKSFAIEPISVSVGGLDDIVRSIASLSEKPNGGLIVTAATFSIVYRKQLASLAIKHKLPAIFWNRTQTADGGLMSFGPDSADSARRSANYVDRILRGERPADLPVQEPTRMELIINVETAKEIGIVVPPTLLARADEVIE